MSAAAGLSADMRSAGNDSRPLHGYIAARRASTSVEFGAEGQEMASGDTYNDVQDMQYNANPGMDSITSQVSRTTTSSGDSLTASRSRSNSEPRPFQNSVFQDDPRPGSPINIKPNSDLAGASCYHSRPESHRHEPEKTSAKLKCTQKKAMKKAYAKTSGETQELMDKTFGKAVAKASSPSSCRASQHQEDKVKGVALKAACGKRVHSTIRPQLESQPSSDSQMVCRKCGRSIRPETHPDRFDDSGTSSLPRHVRPEILQSDFERSLQRRDAGYDGCGHLQEGASDLTSPPHNIIAHKRSSSLPHTPAVPGHQLPLARPDAINEDETTLSECELMRTNSRSLSLSSSFSLNKWMPPSFRRRHSSVLSSAESGYSGSPVNSLHRDQKLQQDSVEVFDNSNLCGECQRDLQTSPAASAQAATDHATLGAEGGSEDVEGFCNVDVTSMPADADLKDEKNFIASPQKKTLLSKLANKLTRSKGKS